MTDHGHRDMRPVSYTTKDIEVAKGVNVVRVPVPVYDEDVVIICEVCAEYAAAAERERLRNVDIMGDGFEHKPYPLPAWVKTPTPKGEAPIDLLTHFRDWLLRDPEAPSDD